MIYESQFLLALLVTVLIELPVLLMFLPLFDDKRFNLWPVLFTGMMASALTLPYLWFILPNYLPANDYIFWGEFIVVVAEALVFIILLRVGVIRSLVASLAANAASYFLGMHIVKYLLTIF